jgi:hypothetical protein
MAFECRTIERMYDLFHQHIIIEPIRLTCRLSGYSNFDSVLLKGVIMKELTYIEKLRSPAWQKKRLEALQHKNFTCEICGSKEKTLNVHHKEYFKGLDPHEYEVDQLSVVCEDCHEKQHLEENYLRWSSSYLNINDRNKAAIVLAGMADLDYGGVLCYIYLKDSKELKKLYELGQKARKIRWQDQEI